MRKSILSVKLMKGDFFLGELRKSKHIKCHFHWFMCVLPSTGQE